MPATGADAFNDSRCRPAFRTNVHGLHRMGLLSIFNRPTDSTPNRGAGGDAADGVQQARIRARQRLIGAVVLVLIGIIGFPLVFETQPRPILIDIPIEIPRKDAAPALTMPTARPSPAPQAPAPSAAAAKAVGEQITTETRAQAGREVVAAVPASAAASAAEAVAANAVVKPVTKPAPVELADAARKPAAVVAKPNAVAEGTRAKALLEGADTIKADGTRFVEQVGAFADAAAARETRLKVEKLGFKTYTQLAETAAGNRIRVRAGPFATRDEAEKALAKAKSAGMNAAVVLTL